MTPSNDVATLATRNTAPVASPPTTTPPAVPAALAPPTALAPVGIGIDVAPFDCAPFDSAQGEGEVVLVARMRKRLVLLNLLNAMLRGGLRWDQLKVSTIAKIA